MDNVLRVCNNGSGGNDDDKCSDLDSGCSDGDGKGGDMMMVAMALVAVAMMARMTVVTVVGNLRL
jgi:hypothetical protein